MPVVARGAPSLPCDYTHRMRSLFVALVLIGCSGSKGVDAPAGDTGDSGDSGDSGACTEAPSTPVSSEAWESAGIPPAGGIWTYVMGPGGVPLYAGSHNTGMWSSMDKGATWTAANVLVSHTRADLAISPTDPQIVYRSSGGVLQRTNDGGQHWVVLPLGTIGVEEVYDVAVAPWNDQRMYGIGNTGISHVSIDGGDSWTTTGTIPVIVSTTGPDPYKNHAWHLLPEVAEGGRVLFTDGSSLYTSDDSGLSWQARFTASLGGHSLARDPTNPAHLLLGAIDGLLESFDEGDSWALRSDVGMNLEYSAWAEDGSWLAVASLDTVYVSDDGGATFTARPHDLAGIEALAIVGDTRLVMAWLDGSAISDDRGVTWTDASTGIVDLGMSVVVADPACAHRVLIATRCSGGVLSSTDWGGAWQHVDNYFHYVMSLHFDPGNADNVWAVSDNVVEVSHDAGASWQTMLRQYHFHGLAVHPEDSNTVLLGSVGSGEYSDSTMNVYKTEDGGVHWTKSSTGLPVSRASAHTIEYWPGNPDVVLLGTYQGEDVSHLSGEGIGLYRSEDGGATWALSSLPESDIAWLDSAAGGVVATTEHGLYRSTDEGVTWQKLDGPDSFMLSVDFQDDTGLALGQDGSVWRSDDGGASWRAAPSTAIQPGNSYLAQINISADATMAWATVINAGVFRLRLR